MPVTFGTSWGATPTQLGDAGGVVTYSIVGAGENISAFLDGDRGRSVDGDSFLNFDFVSVIIASFGEWSTYGDIEFMLIEDQGGAAGATTFPDIRIFFGAIPGNTIGLAYFPTSRPVGIAGDILLDSSAPFSDDPELFMGLVLHEIGHALGLEHSDGDTVMTPVLRQTELGSDDIEGIREVYGPQDNAQPVYRLPSEQDDVNILNSPDDVKVIGNDRDNRIDGTDKAESFNGKAGSDDIVARGGDDTVIGHDGNDDLNGGDGADEMRGGNGSDTIRGESGKDEIIGGPGSDSLVGSNGKDTLKGYSGNDTLRGGNESDDLSGSSGNDQVFGGRGRDSLVGGDGRDTLKGEQDDDTIRGESGSDSITGWSGDDSLVGGPGDDTLKGGKGRDTIKGGTGDDILEGGPWSDVFLFADDHGDDVIRDFDANNDNEKIDLSVVSAISDFDDLLDAASTRGSDVLIDTGNGNSILLENVDLDDLDPVDFIF